MSPRELKVFVSNNGTNWTEFHSYTKSSYTANEVVETSFIASKTPHIHIFGLYFIKRLRTHIFLLTNWKYLEI